MDIRENDTINRYEVILRSMADRKGLFLIIVYSICFLLLGSSIYSLFLEENVNKVQNSLNTTDLSGMINDRMRSYSSGVVGENETVEVTLEPVDPMTALLINEFDGYSIQVPSAWDLDVKEYRYVVHLRNASMKLTIFKHGIDLSHEKVSSYIRYSNDKIKNDYGPMTYVSDETKMIGGKEFTVVTYDREPIITIDNDMPRYRQYHHVHDNSSVFTFIVKTNGPSWNSVIDQIELSLETYQFWEVEAAPDISSVPEREVHGIEMSGERTTISIPDEKKVFGLWHQVHEDYWKELENLEDDLDFEFHFIMDYFNFRTTFEDAREYIHKQYEEGNVMLVSLQPYISSHGEDYDGSAVLFDMLNGEYDQFLMDESWYMGLADFLINTLFPAVAVIIFWIYKSAIKKIIVSDKFIVR